MTVPVFGLDFLVVGCLLGFQIRTRFSAVSRHIAGCRLSALFPFSLSWFDVLVLIVATVSGNFPVAPLADC